MTHSPPPAVENKADVNVISTIYGPSYHEATTNHHHPHHPRMMPPRLDNMMVGGSGPHSALLSQRWNQGQNASILEILDAALEIVEGPMISSSSTTTTLACTTATTSRSLHKGRE